MKILLFYPEYEETFWSFKRILKILGKKAAFPPLGLLTVGAMLPGSWEKKLVDMNTDILKDEYIKWADYIFISAMIVQKESARRIINTIKRFKKPIVAGGPLFTTGWEEFCDVVQLNGRTPRIKSPGQIINELEALYKLGWRAGVFFVDDNLIGNKPVLKKECLPAIIEWQKSRKYPFTFNTQLSINLADDEELMKLLVETGFTAVFVGIETPDSDSLRECGKIQNTNRNLVESVKLIQNMGMAVQGGFIVGFDSDKTSIFQRQIEFIQKSGIVTAMVGLLTALPKTRLYQRLKENKRLVKRSTGDNTSTGGLNFTPKMDMNTLISGYKKVVSTIYSPKAYYERIKTFLMEYKPIKKKKKTKLRIYHLR